MPPPVTPMARPKHLTTLGILILTASLLIGATQAQEGAEAEVEATDQLTFEPETLEIQVGTTVTWTNTGNLIHTVTAEDGSFDGDLMAGQTFSHTFDTPGTYEYYCGPHRAQDMTGTITVVDEENGNGMENGNGETNGNDVGDPPDDEPTDENDTPAPATLLLVLVLAGLVLQARRR
jgi:plastocyanin